MGFARTLDILSTPTKGIIPLTEKRTTTKVKKRSFIAADRSRLSSSWVTGYKNINADIRAGRRILMARARDLVINDTYASKAVSMIDKNVLGPSGFTHRNKAFNLIKKDGKYEREYQQDINYTINELWKDFCKPDNCFLDEQRSFNENLSAILKTIVTDGEMFIVENYTGKYGYQLQGVPSAYCDEMFNKVLGNGNQVVMGIEYNKVWKPVAYYFKKVTSSDQLYNTDIKDYIRIPADRVYHLYRQNFVGQLRGISWFAPSAYRLNIYKSYEEAVLINSRSAAMKTAVLKPKEGVMGETLQNPDVASDYEGEENEDGDIVRDISPGEVYVVPDGYDFTSFDPTFPQAEMGSFSKLILRGFSSGFDLDYPTLSSDHADVNYTSSRSALLDTRLTYKKIQTYLDDHLLTPVRRKWFEYAALKNKIDIKVKDMDSLNKPEFFGYRGEWVDQYKENNADALALEKGLETHTQILGKRGYNFEEFIEQVKYEKETLAEAGIVFSPMPVQPILIDDQEGKKGAKTNA